MAFRDRLFDEEDTEKLRFLSNGCGIQCIWGIHVGNWVGLPDEASCRQACSRSGMAQAPVVLGRGGVAWLLPTPGDSRADGLSLHVRRAGAA